MNRTQKKKPAEKEIEKCASYNALVFHECRKETREEKIDRNVDVSTTETTTTTTKTTKSGQQQELHVK